MELATCIVYSQLENRCFSILKFSQCNEHDAVMVNQAHAFAQMQSWRNQACAFNTEASYEKGGVYSATKDLELQHVNIQVTTGSARASLVPATHLTPRNSSWRMQS